MLVLGAGPGLKGDQALAVGWAAGEVDDVHVAKNS